MLKSNRFLKPNIFLHASRSVMKRGFTLVELLVVIAIIGILSSLSVVSLNSARERARDAQRYNDFRQLFTAMTLYYDTQTSPQYPTMDGSDTWWTQAIAGPNKFFPNPLIDPKPGNIKPYPNAKQAPTTTGGSDQAQHYCVYTKMEGADQYLIVTESGLRTIPAPSPEWNSSTTICDCTQNLCTSQ